MGFANSLTHGGKWVWGTLLAFAGAAAASAMLVNTTAVLRYERDVNRMVFNDNLGVLEEVKGKLGSTEDSLSKLNQVNPMIAADQPYIVVSIAENQIWYKQGNQVLFNTQVATGSGKVMVGGPEGRQYKFETPRGRLTVQEKEVDPAWVHSLRHAGGDTVEEAAAAYDRQLREFGPIDLIHLGLGPDGHTASLFPGSPILRDSRRAIATTQSPKDPPNRLTMTLAAINRASVVLFLTNGSGKAEVVRAILDPKTEAERQLPASLVKPEEGRLIWFLDQAAAAKLPMP